MKTTAVSALVLLAAAGCGGLTHRKDAAAVGQIKTVAIVGLDVVQPRSAVITAPLVDVHSDHVVTIYDALAERLATKLGWTVVPRGDMIANDIYVADYDKTMKGFQNKMLPGDGYNQYAIDHVLDHDSPRILDTGGRDKLIDALRVDAIVVVQVRVEFTGMSIGGLGGRHPQAIVAFDVYTKGKEKSVWFDSFQGKETEGSAGATPIFDESKMKDLVVETTKSAIAKMPDGK
jgi:hypothetical protein